MKGYLCHTGSRGNSTLSTTWSSKQSNTTSTVQQSSAWAGWTWPIKLWGHIPDNWWKPWYSWPARYRLVTGVIICKQNSDIWIFTMGVQQNIFSYKHCAILPTWPYANKCHISYTLFFWHIMLNVKILPQIYWAAWLVDHTRIVGTFHRLEKNHFFQSVNSVFIWLHSITHWGSTT